MKRVPASSGFDIWYWLIVLTLIVVGAMAVASAVQAHDAPKGWSYPWACCANQDCKQVGSADVREPTTIHPSYEIMATGELLAPDDSRIKDSPDGELHLCAHAAGLDAGKTICLFVPTKGF